MPSRAERGRARGRAAPDSVAGGGGRHVGRVGERARVSHAVASVVASNETLTSEALATFAARRRRPSWRRAARRRLTPNSGNSAPCRRARRTTRTRSSRRPRRALRAAAAAAAAGGARKENWHKARVGWVLLRHGRPPRGAYRLYRRRGDDGDPGAGIEPSRGAVIAATRAVLLNAPLDDALDDTLARGGDVFAATAGSPRRRFWSREWVRRPKFGSDEWAAEEALEETDERAAPRFAVLDTDERFDDDAEEEEEEEARRRRADRGASARDAVVVAPSASALAETAALFAETPNDRRGPSRAPRRDGRDRDGIRNRRDATRVSVARRVPARGVRARRRGRLVADGSGVGVRGGRRRRRRAAAGGFRRGVPRRRRLGRRRHEPRGAR